MQESASEHWMHHHCPTGIKAGGAGAGQMSKRKVKVCFWSVDACWQPFVKIQATHVSFTVVFVVTVQDERTGPVNERKKGRTEYRLWCKTECGKREPPVRREGFVWSVCPFASERKLCELRGRLSKIELFSVHLGIPKITWRVFSLALALLWNRSEPFDGCCLLRRGPATVCVCFTWVGALQLLLSKLCSDCLLLLPGDKNEDAFLLSLWVCEKWKFCLLCSSVDYPGHRLSSDTVLLYSSSSVFSREDGSDQGTCSVVLLLLTLTGPHHGIKIVNNHTVIALIT